MAKVKKMAFGGMGSRPPMGGMRPGMRPPMVGLGGNQPPAGANLTQKYNGPPSASSMQSQLQQAQQMAQSRGALGGNQAPANMGAGVPDYAKSYMAQAGQSAAPPAFKSLAGMGAFMKKGGKVKAKAYAKGGTVSSASKRADGCAQRGKTKGRMV